MICTRKIANDTNYLVFETANYWKQRWPQRWWRRVARSSVHTIFPRIVTLFIYSFAYKWPILIHWILFCVTHEPKWWKNNERIWQNNDSTENFLHRQKKKHFNYMCVYLLETNCTFCISIVKFNANREKTMRFCCLKFGPLKDAKWVRQQMAAHHNECDAEFGCSTENVVDQIYSNQGN